MDDLLYKLDNDGICVLPNEFNVENLYLEYKQLLIPKPNTITRVKDPLVNFSKAVEIAASKKVISLLKKFFSKDFYFFSASIKTTNPGRLLSKTQRFHRDPEGGGGISKQNLIKTFVYLNDVTMDHGPFTFVKTSHKINKLGFGKRFTDEDVIEEFGEDKICYLTANKGDVIICSTKGLHKGLSPLKYERNMLTCYYVYDWHRPKVKVRKKFFDGLDDEQKYVMRNVVLV